MNDIKKVFYFISVGVNKKSFKIFSEIYKAPPYVNPF